MTAPYCRTLDDYLLYRVARQEDDCWLWVGARDSEGYGSIRREGRTLKSHRWFYEQMVGRIPDGMQLDHLCRVRHCVNPDHLELVTPGENQVRGLRGFSLTGLCRAGLHDVMSEGSVRIWPDGSRHCKQCYIDGYTRYDAAKRGVRP